MPGPLPVGARLNPPVFRSGHRDSSTRSLKRKLGLASKLACTGQTPLAEAMGSASLATDVRSDAAGLSETDRQPVTDPRETTGSTSLLLTLVDGSTGEPVPRIVATLIPKDAVAFAYENVQGVSDLNGEILWENLSWHQVRVFPPFSEETFSLEPGQRNERTHELEFRFTILGTACSPDETCRGIAECCFAARIVDSPDSCDAGIYNRSRDHRAFP